MVFVAREYVEGARWRLLIVAAVDNDRRADFVPATKRRQQLRSRVDADPEGAGWDTRIVPGELTEMQRPVDPQQRFDGTVERARGERLVDLSRRQDESPLMSFARQRGLG